MQTTLYLDTARMGQMSQLACDASIDFARFAAEHGCTLYCSELLKCGFSHWPTAFQQRYPGLRHWNGIFQFKADLRRLAQTGSSSEVLLASRSAMLMKLAARLLAGPCRNVLVTDSIWPAYQNILQRQFGKGDCRFTQIPIRRQLLKEALPVDELITLFTCEYLRHNCDGLFLPLVDNLGIRLPIEKIVEAIRKSAELRFVVVDGAQSLGHVPLRLDSNYCDFCISGSHKWLRAYHSMGIGFYGNPGSRDYISHAIGKWTNSGIFDDPLNTFANEIATGQEQLFGETVQVLPMLAANAATQDALLGSSNGWINDRTASEGIVSSVRETGWRPLLPDPELRTQILLLESDQNPMRRLNSDCVRRALLDRGVALTSYPNGMLRLSAPPKPLSKGLLRRLNSALLNISDSLHPSF